MKKSVSIKLIPLALAIPIWYLVLRQKDSEIMSILNTVPIFKEKKGELFRNVGIEAGKLALTYLALSFVIK